MKAVGLLIAWITVFCAVAWISGWILSEALGIYGVDIGIGDAITTLMGVATIGWAFSLNQVVRKRRDEE